MTNGQKRVFDAMTKNGLKRVKNFRTNLEISGQGQNFRTFQDKFFFSGISGISGQVGALLQ